MHHRIGEGTVGVTETDRAHQVQAALAEWFKAKDRELAAQAAQAAR